MQLILKNFPNFEVEWQEHLAWWDGDPAGLSNDMAAFSRYVLGLLKKNQHNEETQEIFIFVEKLLIEGDEAVGNAAATCFLENLINAISWGRVPANFIYLMGPESKKYCKAWDDFTGVKTEGLD